MAKWIITWDAGYGRHAEIIEAETYDEASVLAFDNWKEDAETSAEFDAVLYSKELAYGLSLEDDDEE